MAKQMMHSAFTVSHFMVSEEVIMDSLIDARVSLKHSFEQQGVKLSYMPFFIKAMSMALSQFPLINSRVNSDCTELTYIGEHNIGLAVDSKVGLAMPTLKVCRIYLYMKLPNKQTNKQMNWLNLPDKAD